MCWTAIVVFMCYHVQIVQVNMPMCLRSGCGKKIPPTGASARNAYFAVQEPGKSEIKAQIDIVPGDSLLWVGCRLLYSCCSSHGTERVHASSPWERDSKQERAPWSHLLFFLLFYFSFPFLSLPLSLLSIRFYLFI